MDINGITTYEEKSVELQLRQIICRELIDGRNLVLRENKDYVKDKMCLTLCKYLAVDIVKEESIDVYFYHPSSWWQMFKRDVVPFLLRFSPLKQTTVRKVVFVERGGAYPSFPIRNHEPITPVKFVTIKE
jgi:hypothetical protein